MAAKHILSFLQALMKGQRTKNTDAYKEAAKKIDDQLEEIKKVQTAREDELKKLN